MVIRDEDGKVIMAAVKKLEVGCKATMAEAAAARYGLQIARRRGYDRIWLA